MLFGLPWRLADPAGREPPAPERIRALARSALARAPGRRDRHQLGVQRELGCALLSGLGAWAAGWSWGAVDGGVSAWCCASHSVVGTDPEIAGRVVAAVESWHGWLVELADSFELVDLEGEGLPEAEAVGLAASTLLPIVLERTGAEDAWYRTFDLVLGWYLQHRAGTDEDMTHLVAQAVAGRFESWIAPEAGLAEQVCSDVGRAAADREPPLVDDALEAWWAVRRTVKWGRFGGRKREAARQDGHLLYIEARDRARSAVRATRMRSALDKARKDALAGRTLRIARLKEWNRTLLGRPARLRAADAFARGGTERYGRPPDLERRLKRCLEDCADASVIPTARAARAYLDVCFLHPFEDGNARLARLLADHVLTGAGLRLEAGDPVFALPRFAHDPKEPGRLFHALEWLTGLLP